MSMGELARAVTRHSARQRHVAGEFAELLTVVAKEPDKNGSAYELAGHGLHAVCGDAVLRAALRDGNRPADPQASSPSFRNGAARQGLFPPVLSRGSPEAMGNHAGGERMDADAERAGALASVRGRKGAGCGLAGSRRKASDHSGRGPAPCADGRPCAALRGRMGAARRSISRSGRLSRTTGFASGTIIIPAGMHPAEPRLDDGEVAFDPLGNTCSQQGLRVRHADIAVREPSVNSNPELLLNVIIRMPGNPKTNAEF